MAGNLAQVKQIFLDAREQPDGGRDAFLTAACGADAELKAAVESLLAADAGAGAGRFLDAPPATTALFDQLQRAVAGRFSLERELRRGGMGIVYLARDVALDRPVAIKLLPPALAADPAYRTRFLREARTAAGLSHPNIVPIHLVEEREGLVFFVMAFVDGESLGDRVRRAGPLKHSEVAKMVQEVAWALAYAHGRGVIHRDIKPDNILLERGSGRALVTDFGIARVNSAATMSHQGEVMGTLAYMSPEQATSGAAIDGRADLYSLGVTAFFALTGRLPFDAADPAALAAMHLSEPAPPVRSVNGGVPARLAEAVDRCLAKDPDTRYASGEALADAIAGAQLTRREIAPSVREFLGAAKNGMVQAVIVGMMWLGAAAVADTFGSVVLQVMLMAITPLVLLYPFAAARGVLRAGLDHRDVAEAVASAATDRDANVDYEVARVTRLSRWFATIPSRAIFLAAAVPIVFIFPGIVADLLEAGVSFKALGIAFYLLLYVCGVEVFFLGMAIDPKKTVAVLTRGTPENAGLLKRLWAGRFGRWLFRIAGIGLRKPAAVPAPESAPTEVLLGRAAAELFDKLPADERARLGDVRDVIRRLEQAAAGLRERRDDVTRALADAGGPGGSERRDRLVAELEAARAAIERRLGSAVGGLENLRIELLRLRAGVGSADGLTGTIEEARQVGEAVAFEVAARREIAALQ